MGLVAPTGTPEDPEPVIRRLHAETAAALGAPDVREGLARQGAEAATSTPEEFRQLTAADIARWSGVVHWAGLAPDRPDIALRRSPHRRPLRVGKRTLKNTRQA